MKWATHELQRLVHIDNSFRYTADLAEFLNEDLVDVMDIGPAEISGTFHCMEEEGRYLFEVNVECTLTMACAITLDPVSVPLRFDAELEFGKDPQDDYTIPIEGNTIDLDPAVFAEIMIQKPMRVLSPHAYDHYQEEIVTLDEDEKNESNPFAKLKK
jgi:uncharacterized metal-binding protein YceD (DUF177 family)